MLLIWLVQWLVEKNFLIDYGQRAIIHKPTVSVAQAVPNKHFAPDRQSRAF